MKERNCRHGRANPSAFRFFTAITLTASMLLAGCETGTKTSGLAPALQLDAAIAQATQNNKPLLVLVTQSHHSHADNRVRGLFEKLTSKATNGIVPVLLDVSNPQSRADAARYHATNTPVLVCLSSRGVIVARNAIPITKELILDRINFAAKVGFGLDAKLATLEQAAAKNPTNVLMQLELADFLLNSGNAREAIPRLATAAQNKFAANTQRTRAWVEQCLAYFWISEPEQGKRAAEELIATVGEKSYEALAAGHFVLGLQNANEKNMPLARQEFEAAVKASPKSVYGIQAAEALEQIPKTGK